MKAALQTDWRLREETPVYGKPMDVVDGIRRIVAPNPHSMTYHGTNTWLITHAAATAVVDPGTDDPAHLDAICGVSGTISHVIVTHWHHDHFDGAHALALRANVPVFKFPSGPLKGDKDLLHGAEIAGMRVIHTPGHAEDHICLERSDGVLLSGDHVMGWSTTLVPPPPDGDLGDYIESLERVQALNARIFLPGHGPEILKPYSFIEQLLEKRYEKLHQIENILTHEVQEFSNIFERAYPKLSKTLRFAAEMMLETYLLELKKRGKAIQEPAGWKRAGF
ncbi:MBL fold metallo-hydrolase [Acetobacter senegalensis]|uniref:Putative metallo-beta-lactamase superfamily protein n=1 Tax=Acetobacter tropicalis NBRC 101654 TaxID=749388 RepID=F7VAG0_9PROT|nr:MULTISPECIES: MBL fold metallo-hydrolase [Acetobacter]MCG4254048.1 MBL fold metallo-hydrolase [Acetobacter senegalensis]GAA07355.1 putative metallo-beta-lactamase superfamily protein [Acetobacter tropicalis NBRC 101654]